MKKIVLVLIAVISVSAAFGQRSNRKNAPAVVEAGRAFLDEGLIEQAKENAAEAVRLDKEYFGTYILRGDILLAEGAEPGEVAGEYEQAKYFEPSSPVPYLKLAEVYQNASPATALDNIRKAIELDPNNATAQNLFGKVYISLGRYPEAIEALKTSFSAGEYSVDDVEHIARAYYFVEPEKLGMSEEDKYAEAKRWVDEGLVGEPDHFILNRYRMYLDAKTGNPSAVEDAERFFTLAGGDNKVLPIDHVMYGTILAQAGDREGAVREFDRAVALDPRHIETYEELVAHSRKSRDYAQAAKYYEKMVDIKGQDDLVEYDGDKLLDINTLGNLYYQAGIQATTDSLARRESLLRAEGLFKQLTELAPESYTGYYYLARTGNALYPAMEGIENGIPKEYYARTVSIIEGRTEDEPASAMMTAAVREGLGYLAYYYYMTDGLDNALLYSEKLLEIDPQNPNASAIKEDILSRQ